MLDTNLPVIGGVSEEERQLLGEPVERGTLKGALCSAVCRLLWLGRQPEWFFFV